VELAGKRGMGDQGHRDGRSEGLEDGVEGWQMVTLEEQEVLQQRNQNPLRLHGAELDARLGWQRQRSQQRRWHRWLSKLESWVLSGAWLP
jgi:hypothetical protein